MNTIVNQEQQTNEGTVAGWKQAYTDVTNGLYQKIYELKQSESVVAELRDELANMENLYNDLQEQVDNYGEPEDLAAERDNLQEQVDDYGEPEDLANQLAEMEKERDELCDKYKLARHDARASTDAYARIKARLDLANGHGSRYALEILKKTPPPVAPRKKSC
tara:strand:- start:235 stop:723 length:489 start_codon:yes stop_codon:yes gene_type:complete